MLDGCCSAISLSLVSCCRGGRAGVVAARRHRTALRGGSAPVSRFRGKRHTPWMSRSWCGWASCWGCWCLAVVLLLGSRARARARRRHVAPRVVADGPIAPSVEGWWRCMVRQALGSAVGGGACCTASSLAWRSASASHSCSGNGAARRRRSHVQVGMEKMAEVALRRRECCRVASPTCRSPASHRTRRCAWRSSRVYQVCQAAGPDELACA